MSKLFRLAAFVLIVSGLNVQSASACWLRNPFNTCGTNNKCCSPCHTPQYTTPALCDPCMGYSAQRKSFWRGPSFLPPNRGCNNCQSSYQSGYQPTNSYPMTGSVYPQGVTAGMAAPGFSTQGIPQQSFPQQFTTPPTWTTTPPLTVPPQTHSELQFPPEAEDLDSTQIEWETVRPHNAKNQASKESVFKNASLQEKRQPVRSQRKRSFRAPSAVAVWQHLNSSR